MINGSYYVKDKLQYTKLVFYYKLFSKMIKFGNICLLHINK